MNLLFVANWKMNMLSKDLDDYFQIFTQNFKPLENEIDTVFAPPFTLLSKAQTILNFHHGISLGAQNAHWLDAGAHTGEISCSMLKDFGVSHVILGHSERRQFYGETNGGVAKRAKAVLTSGLKAIVCIGEKDYRDDGSSSAEILQQLRESLLDISSEESNNLVIAYEPVWAIGTGRAATPEIVNNVHNLLRKELKNLFTETGKTINILYGGSTTPENIQELSALENVGGALVGGASLKPDVFNRLIINGRKGKN